MRRVRRPGRSSGIPPRRASTGVRRRDELDGTDEFNRQIATLLDELARQPVRPTLQEATRRFQGPYVLETLEAHRRPGGHRWNIAAAARALGVARSYLYELIAEFDLRIEDE